MIPLIILLALILGYSCAPLLLLPFVWLFRREPAQLPPLDPEMERRCSKFYQPGANKNLELVK